MIGAKNEQEKNRCLVSICSRPDYNRGMWRQFCPDRHWNPSSCDCRGKRRGRSYKSQQYADRCAGSDSRSDP